MKQTKECIKNISEVNVIDPITEENVIDPELTIICKHCGKPINQTQLIGLSLICPLCGKPQNGKIHLHI